MTKNPLAVIVGVIPLLALLLWPGAQARAALRLDITSGRVQPMPIAIPAFAGGGAEAQAGAEIAGVISADLERSGLVPADRSAQFHPKCVGDRQ